jgi:hypothetical protein
MRILVLSTAAVLTGLALYSCGDDDDSHGTGDTSFDGGAEKNGKSVGQGGSRASRGEAGAAEEGAPSCVTSRTCGTETCSSSDIDGSAFADMAQGMNGTGCIEACCTTDNECGSRVKIVSYSPGVGMMVIAATTCTKRDLPGTETEACPRYFDSFAGVKEDAGSTMPSGLDALNFMGCCRPDGTCGYLVSIVGLGCLSSADTRAMLPFAGLTDTEVTTCVPSD